MYIKKLAKRVIPSSLITVVRTSVYSWQVGLLIDYIKTATNRSRVIRLGSDYGGWVIPKGAIQSGDVCYCVGCGEDITFDLELIQRYGCTVHGVDPTPRSISFVRDAIKGNEKYYFHEFALWTKKGQTRFYSPAVEGNVSYSLSDTRQSASYITVDTIRLSSLLNNNAHKNIKLLKLDIEGAESKVLETFFEDDITVDVLCVEFDGLVSEKSEDRQEVKEIIKQITQSYDLLWAEGLNFTFVQK